MPKFQITREKNFEKLKIIFLGTAKLLDFRALEKKDYLEHLKQRMQRLSAQLRIPTVQLQQHGEHAVQREADQLWLLILRAAMVFLLLGGNIIDCVAAIIADCGIKWAGGFLGPLHRCCAAHLQSFRVISVLFGAGQKPLFRTSSDSVVIHFQIVG